MNTRLEKAIAEYKKAQKEHSESLKNYNIVQKNTQTIIDRICGSKTGSDKFQAWKDGKTEIDNAATIENEAKQKTNFTQAVLFACGENVADIACNVFMEEYEKNKKDFSMPLHYKKFESNFYKVLPEEYFYFENNYGYSMYIAFRLAPYGHNRSYCMSIESGYLKQDDRDKTKHESTLAEIKKEAKQAFKDAEKLRKIIDGMKKNYPRNKYNTHIRYMLPYLEINCLHDDYRLF